ncbi:MAG: 2Fe-2S iron-sulfur cluster-binding protein [Bilophila wadsworthia]
MPDDSMAIYSRLPGHPNVTLVNTHSAVTMAAAHTRLLPDFILGGELPETAQGMTLKRFGYCAEQGLTPCKNASTVHITFRRAADEVPAGISVAAAVLGHAHAGHTCNSVDGSARAPYCLMGVCFECLMEIDGEPDVQSCLVTVREGMVVRRQLPGEAE